MPDQKKIEDFHLRDIQPSDAAAIVTNLNNREVVGWLAQPPFPYTPADFDDFLARKLRGWPYRSGIAVDELVVGVVSIDPHLGYWLDPNYWGRRIMHRAATALIDAWFRVEYEDEITSGVFEGNERSLRLLKGLGFRETGVSTVYCRPLGEDRVHIDMALSRSAWGART